MSEVAPLKLLCRLLIRRGELNQKIGSGEVVTADNDYLQNCKDLGEINKKINSILLSVPDDDDAQSLIKNLFPNTPMDEFSQKCHINQSRQQVQQSNDPTIIKLDNGGIKGSSEPKVTTKWTLLKKSPIRGLSIGKPNPERYLLGKIITFSYKFVGITFFLADSFGESILASIYNYPIGSTLPELDLVFHPGRIVLWKRPFLKPSSRGRNLLLRMDNATNLTFIDDLSDPILKDTPWFVKPKKKTASEWKKEGNDHYRNKHWRKALICYSLGLELDPGSSVLLSNRSQVFLNQGEWEKALKDANSALIEDPDSLKSKVRRAKALSQMERYKDAVEAWRACGDHMLKEKEKAALALLQFTTGSGYDWDSILNTDLPDCSTYLHPLVERKEVLGKGKGLVAQEDLPEGTLILIEAPLAIGDPSTGRNRSITVLFSENRASDNGFDACLDSLLQKSLTNSHLRKKLNDLSTSDVESSNEEQSLGMIARNILLSCAWGVPPLGRSVGKSDLEEKTGLYYCGSFFNHSCEPNCALQFANTICVVRTAENIRKGEELTVTYIGHQECLSKRREMLKSRCFTCKCNRCLQEESLQKEWEVFQNIEKKLKTKAENCEPIHNLVMMNKAVNMVKKFFPVSGLQLMLLREASYLSSATNKALVTRTLRDLESALFPIPNSFYVLNLNRLLLYKNFIPKAMMDSLAEKAYHVTPPELTKQLILAESKKLPTSSSSERQPANPPL